MARANFTYLAVMAFLLSACSVLEPFVDRKRNAGAPPTQLYVGRSRKDAPSICYNILTTDYKTVKKWLTKNVLSIIRGHMPSRSAKRLSAAGFYCRPELILNVKNKQEDS